MRDGYGCVSGIRWSGLAADTGVGAEIGIALRIFPGAEGWHIGRGAGGVKRVGSQNNRLFGNCRARLFTELASRRETPPNEPAGDKACQQHAKDNYAAQ